MAERRVLPDDAHMVSMAELSDAGRCSEMASHGGELVGVERTVVCGLDADARREPIGFAACLARRLGWRLALVPLPEAAALDERLGRLLAVSRRDRAGFVVTEAVRSGAGAAALVELSRGAACPLIAVPRGAPALGTGPILCGVVGSDPAGTAVRAASHLANVIGAPLRPVDLAPSGDGASPDGVVAAVLRDSQAPVMLVPGGAAIPPARQAA